ncbi:MAG: hypothetical protein OIN85_05650 [Candidatus Methanoperedens sp.]|nr:hypothetical protein [Candidatus Methanoperedens sp.]
MSSISIEENNEKKLTVDEYVRYLRIKGQIQKVLDDAKIKETLCDAEESVNGLTIDMTIRYTVDKKK